MRKCEKAEIWDIFGSVLSRDLRDGDLDSCGVVFKNGNSCGGVAEFWSVLRGNNTYVALYACCQKHEDIIGEMSHVSWGELVAEYVHGT